MPRESNPRRALDRSSHVLAAIAVVFFIATALYWARVIFIPVALAIYFAFILTPLVIWLQKRHIPRVAAVMLVVMAAFVSFTTVGVVVGRQVIQLTRTLPDHSDKIKAKVALIKDWVSANEGSRFAELVNDVYDSFADRPRKSTTTGDGTAVVIEPQPSWVSHAQGLLSPAAEILGQAFFTLILLVFMLNRREDLRNRLIRLLGPGRMTTTTKAVDETSRRVSRFLLVQFLLNSSFGLVITVSLWMIGVPYPPIWGFVAFLMRYVPYVGTWIAVIPPTLFTFAVSDSSGPLILVLVIFIGLELLIGNVAEPLLYGHSLGLSEVAQLVAAAFWALLWGPVGLILSGPLTVCLLVLGKYVPQLRFLSVLLGDEPVLSPRIAFYQRLAARDQDEAADIIEKELAARPVDQICDDILIPVLAAARADVNEGRLADDDLQFIATAVREIVEEALDAPSDESVPEVDPVRILLTPAKDAVDWAAADVFGQTINRHMWDVELTPARMLTSELIVLIEKTRPAAVVIAALPLGGLTHTRYLCKRLHQRFPELKLVVGRWAVDGEDAAGWLQLGNVGADVVTNSFAETKAFLEGWRAVLAAPDRPRKAETRTSQLVGTASA
ncbi:MAG TPA: AI-2E family transporter [Gemmataceae bacterium]|nr:AI-2E family transporter [Gemmataceae bacterium]